MKDVLESLDRDILVADLRAKSSTNTVIGYIIAGGVSFLMVTVLDDMIVLEHLTWSWLVAVVVGVGAFFYSCYKIVVEVKSYMYHYEELCEMEDLRNLLREELRLQDTK